MTKIALFHPNLGIGGAEKMMIEIAKSLKRQKNHVEFFTSYHDENHCFSETRGDFKVNCHFSWLSDEICGGFKAYLAALKMILVTLYFLFFHKKAFDLVIVDQIAVVAIPLLKFFRIPVVYYCHFPDLFLSTRNSFLKKIYRYPLDTVEIFCTARADMILVNSEYTMGRLTTPFESILKKRDLDPSWIKVVYPCVSSDEYSILPEKNLQTSSVDGIPAREFLFVSINRFHPTKLLIRAVKGMEELEKVMDPDTWKKTHMVIMGGCDPNVESDRVYFDHICEEAHKRKLMSENPEYNKVTLLKNPSDEVKRAILGRAVGLIYTPEFEHFGIVPVEAMLMGVPVLSASTGGPLETVVDGETGFHIASYPDDLADKMAFLITNPELRKEMGLKARAHCVAKFSLQSLDENMAQVMDVLISKNLLV